MLYNAQAYAPLLDDATLSWFIYAAFGLALFLTALLAVVASRAAGSSRQPPDLPGDDLGVEPVTELERLLVASLKKLDAEHRASVADLNRRMDALWTARFWLFPTAAILLGLAVAAWAARNVLT